LISILVSRIARFPRTGTRRLAAAAALALAASGAWAADVQRGATLYRMHCAVCHGQNGTPILPGAPDFRRFDSLLRPDQQLLQGIRSGKGAMPGFMGVLKDREILDVIAYLRTLS
jgi:cytochrome c6